MQMARCSDRRDPRYRAISGVLKQFLRSWVRERVGDRVEGIPSASSHVETHRAANTGEVSGGPSGW
jgi:hypothetical protein